MGRSGSTGLSFQPDERQGPDAGARRARAVLLAALLVAVLGGLGYFGYALVRRGRQLDRQIATLTAEVQEANLRSREALERAQLAETSARSAAEGRQVAETKTAAAQVEAETARTEASTARDEAAAAKAEADRIRQRAEAEMNRLEDALGKIAETRRTALGVVMNLGSDYLKFEFDKAELRPEDRELLSRVAGILLTSQDYTVSVNGHTDDVGSDAYNQKLSERRAQAVRDYLLKAGLPADILSVTGHGKAVPLVKGSTDAARAKNRRVELGIANTRIQYGRSPSP
jgi:outer membrane protein OmpA-like peptidoglycan-associated protein